ncbi:dTDP-4-amino-4,6-dideoxygalactose transaminase [Stenomitos frigidus ULC18]|uniref:dTDP-4-amino-4,6-dideoxygalactose transaminase n=1 Tax=Stenomitos frigidus ULC18 TaxID=2107698 RepID=A0A2T1DW63_9CYAN|nr:dTDP-4-amino-4,6-dideoxygalactose transaminase [Stenomitos frigidus ULC18]
MGNSTNNIPFNKLYTTNQELEYISQAIANGQIAGDEAFTKKCQQWLKQALGSQKVLLTHSCTAALEMAVILAGIQPGDEVIMPSYTFVSTANAVVLRGGIPVFVDIRPDTLNIDETLVEAAITSKTKAIMPVHYAGMSCEMDTIKALAAKHGLALIEDAAQGFGSTYKGQPVGSLGQMAAFSFHATKNIVSGEGGALAINDPALIERAEIVWEKGTNRSQFFRGTVDKYTWVDVGSSYLPSDLLAAFLWAQLGYADEIKQRRLRIWHRYNKAFAELELQRRAQRPTVPSECQHNAHIYYLLVNDIETRTRVLSVLKQHGVQATFHYVPLHSAPAGRKYARAHGELSVTEDICDRIVRLPLSAALTTEEVDRVIGLVLQTLAA